MKTIIDDEITFTFALKDGTETHLVQIWARDARENDDVAALVAGIVTLIQTYTGQEAII